MSWPYSAARCVATERYSWMRRSISGRKWRMSPCTGQAAPSASAQIVWPSISFDTSYSMSISATEALPATIRTLTRHTPPDPAGPLAARGALAAALMLVELRQAGNRAHDIGGFVHDDHGGGAEPA